MRVTWKRPLNYTDKTPIKEGGLKGFEILIDDMPAIPVSPAWSASGEYAEDINLPLEEGEHRARVVAVSSGGQKSVPSEAFAFSIAPRVPEPPLDVAVSLTA